LKSTKTRIVSFFENEYVKYAKKRE